MSAHWRDHWRSTMTPKLEAVIVIDAPAESKFLVDGEDIGAKQIEVRMGPTSNNEVVCRIPRELVKVTIVHKAKP